MQLLRVHDVELLMLQLMLKDGRIKLIKKAFERELRPSKLSPWTPLNSPDSGNSGRFEDRCEAFP